MNKFYKVLRNKKGEVTISTSIIIIVFVSLFALSLTFFSAFTRYNTQNTMAYEIVRYAEIKGRTGGAVENEIERIEQASGFDCDVSWTASYIDDKNDKVQLGDEMSLTLTSKSYIGIGGIVKIPVPIKSRATGRSEMYWK